MAASCLARLARRMLAEMNAELSAMNCFDFTEYNPLAPKYNNSAVGGGCWCQSACNGINIYDDPARDGGGLNRTRIATEILGPCLMTLPQACFSRIHSAQYSSCPSPWPVSSTPCTTTQCEAGWNQGHAPPCKPVNKSY
jgi:hypothetical protein